ncbi:MAG: NHLP bacteriocin system secretion protein, partial [Clostridia bacterium]|nr:NHLP bacteriocin system secretion protein [Clostridia bacterium]
MSKKIFREKPLQNLSSVDQLDQLIKVTSARGWLALAGIGVILISVLVWAFFGTLTSKVSGSGILLNNGGVYNVVHNTSGQVLDIRYKSGDIIEKGSVIARIELPDSVIERGSSEDLIRKSQIISPLRGRILEINIQEGSMVVPGETLVVLEQQDSTTRLEAVLYVSAEEGEKIRPGMEAQISPSIVNKEEYGFMLGRVITVADYPATEQSMVQTLGNANLASLLRGAEIPLKVEIDLITSLETKSGYRWSSSEG